MARYWVSLLSGFALMLAASVANIFTGILAPCGAENSWTAALLYPAVPGVFFGEWIGMSDVPLICLAFISGALIYGILAYFAGIRFVGQ